MDSNELLQDQDEARYNLAKVQLRLVVWRRLYHIRFKTSGLSSLTYMPLSVSHRVHEFLVQDLDVLNGVHTQYVPPRFLSFVGPPCLWLRINILTMELTTQRQRSELLALDQEEQSLLEAMARLQQANTLTTFRCLGCVVQ